MKAGLFTDPGDGDEGRSQRARRAGLIRLVSALGRDATWERINGGEEADFAQVQPDHRVSDSLLHLLQEDGVKLVPHLARRNGS